MFFFWAIYFKCYYFTLSSQWNVAGAARMTKREHCPLKLCGSYMGECTYIAHWGMHVHLTLERPHGTLQTAVLEKGVFNTTKRVCQMCERSHAAMRNLSSCPHSLQQSKSVTSRRTVYLQSCEREFFNLMPHPNRTGVQAMHSSDIQNPGIHKIRAF